MADLVQVFDAATYEAALALLADRAAELGLALTELAAVPDGQPPFAVYNDGVYRCPHCDTEQVDVVTVLMATTSLRGTISTGVFSREHNNQKRDAIRAAPLVAAGRRCPRCGGWIVPDRLTQ